MFHNWQDNIPYAVDLFFFFLYSHTGDYIIQLQTHHRGIYMLSVPKWIIVVVTHINGPSEALKTRVFLFFFLQQCRNRTSRTYNNNGWTMNDFRSGFECVSRGVTSRMKRTYREGNHKQRNAGEPTNRVRVRWHRWAEPTNQRPDSVTRENVDSNPRRQGRVLPLFSSPRRSTAGAVRNAPVSRRTTGK